MMRLTIAAVLLALLAAPVSAAKSSASCAVTPSVVASNGTLSITASSDTTLFDFYLQEPVTGRAYYWPTNLGGTVTYTTAIPSVGATPVPGAWTVVVEDVGVRHPTHKAIASCGFTVLP